MSTDWRGYRQRSSAVECICGGGTQDESRVREDLESENGERQTVLVLGLWCIRDCTEMEAEAANEVERGRLLGRITSSPSSILHSDNCGSVLTYLAIQFRIKQSPDHLDCYLGTSTIDPNL